MMIQFFSKTHPTTATATATSKTFISTLTSTVTSKSYTATVTATATSKAITSTFTGTVTSKTLTQPWPLPLRQARLSPPLSQALSPAQLTQPKSHEGRLCVPPSVPKRQQFHTTIEAGGARDAHWTGTNEDASVTSVISIQDAGLTYLLDHRVIFTILLHS